MKEKILILGHKGLLGNMVYLYFNSKKYEIVTTTLRWPDDNFKSFVINEKPDVIINCIGIIPQRKPEEKLYDIVNYQLPMWLDSLNIKIIHPDTDEDDSTTYGLFKKMAREGVKNNTKILKTSIMGFENGTKFSLLEWFLNSEGEINGFTNQFWNGNTTLEWAKWSEKLIIRWNFYKNIITLENPECLSKYKILLTIKNIFNKDINIIPTRSNLSKNNCMVGDYKTKDLVLQIIEMKSFYEKNKKLL